jgi:hypothetical protein
MKPFMESVAREHSTPRADDSPIPVGSLILRQFEKLAITRQICASEYARSQLAYRKRMKGKEEKPRKR